ncbi:MAG: prepilin-type N-terminal cleavage/methylation domain-containing protein [Planctomycetes bacterium]|nr:prepilin-type N-terminal cleavage/methylation domain-containing protein [Planctomycetota bacterium]
MKRPANARLGFTLVELVIATGLLALLMIAVFSLLDGALTMWDKAEVRRELGDRNSGVMDLMAGELRSMESGAHGDAWFDWFDFDTDGDELRETAWPRLRFVRQASAAEVARITALDPEPKLQPALVEVVYMVLPSNTDSLDHRSLGVLWRGVRLTSADTQSFLADDFFRRTGDPAPGSVEEVTGGVLWLGVLCATQTSIVHDGWELGDELADAATAWDAWSKDRLDPTRHPWNVPGAGMPAVGDSALLPRRVRIELVLEREADLRRRTRLADLVTASDNVIVVDDPHRIPARGELVKIDGEWLEVGERIGSRVMVKRGLRGTPATVHEAGARIHYGERLVREVPIELYREDWNL